MYKKNYFVIFLTTFLFGFFCIILKPTKNGALYVGADNSSKAILNYNNSAVGKFLSEKKKYENLKNLKEVDSSKKTIDGVLNFDQNELNNYYNENNKKNRKIDNTCCIVACTEQLYYFGNIRGEFDIPEENYKESFIRVFDVNNDYWNTSKKNGTWSPLEDNCVTDTFNTYGSSRIGDTNVFLLWNNIKDSVKGSSPILLDLSDHCVLVAGLTEYEYTYTKIVKSGWWLWEKKTKKEVTETMEFVIVCEGWGRDSLSLIPKESIGSLWNGMQVTWAV